MAAIFLFTGLGWFIFFYWWFTVVIKFINYQHQNQQKTLSLSDLVYSMIACAVSLFFVLQAYSDLNITPMLFLVPAIIMIFIGYGFPLFYQIYSLLLMGLSLYSFLGISLIFAVAQQDISSVYSQIFSITGFFFAMLFPFTIGAQIRLAKDFFDDKK